jgi:hypothetical protein
MERKQIGLTLYNIFCKKVDLLSMVTAESVVHSKNSIVVAQNTIGLFGKYDNTERLCSRAHFIM